MTEALNIDLFSPDFRANPYPEYAQAREREPIYKVALPGGRSTWLITRYEDAEEILRDPRFIKDGRSLVPPDQRLEQRFPNAEVIRQVNDHMLSSDPPDHTRLRGLVNRAFTPRMVEQWRARIQAIAEELLDAVQDKGEMELIGDFAFPLTMTVISEMLGIPQEDRLQFREWSNIVISGFGDQESFMQRLPVMQAFAQYLAGLIVLRRKQPLDDLVSNLVVVEAEGDKLSENELISMIFLLLIAGHETTVNLIGNGVLALLQHPEQLEMLRREPDLIRTAVEELLRYNGPLFTATGRWAREDVEFKGTLIRRGEMVMVGLASANHDEEQFSHGEELDITRKENPHLAFGKGIHYCLGAPLARLEGQIAIGALIRRFPHLRLKVDPQTLTWRSGTLVHALDRLPVAFSASGEQG
ncbi:MAG: cytochrome P450 [Ktedonobacteraceae bacterium]|nr:cytochrome P450 [Ktedonobacteraceae bacterium]